MWTVMLLSACRRVELAVRSLVLHHCWKCAASVRRSRNRKIAARLGSHKDAFGIGLKSLNVISSFFTSMLEPRTEKKSLEGVTCFGTGTSAVSTAIASMNIKGHV